MSNAKRFDVERIQPRMSQESQKVEEENNWKVEKNLLDINWNWNARSVKFLPV